MNRGSTSPSPNTGRHSTSWLLNLEDAKRQAHAIWDDGPHGSEPTGFALMDTVEDYFDTLVGGPCYGCVYVYRPEKQLDGEAEEAQPREEAA